MKIDVVKFSQTYEEEQVPFVLTIQRAAGGGIAAGRGNWEWASEGELKVSVGEPERVLR
ncbi:hypothetical protein [Clostridium sp. D5]|uniref:hypothetical protein n=1 Tax=Clostridium sp. D5 TaxID=556261 RepID=UPI0001FC7BAE|nr:hypothetical protein [Clostridium sp. D5]EGB92146.1 hypothetical protein HMPREF0240_02826 [Clostridium sp. D5]